MRRVGLWLIKGKDTLMEAIPSPEVKGVAQYEPFHMGSLKGEHVFP